MEEDGITSFVAGHLLNHLPKNVYVFNSINTSQQARVFFFFTSFFYGQLLFVNIL